MKNFISITVKCMLWVFGIGLALVGAITTSDILLDKFNDWKEKKNKEKCEEHILVTSK